MLHLFFNIKPEPKLRPRFSKYGAYTPVKTKIFEDDLKVLARRQLPPGFELYTKPIEVKMVFHFVRPKTVPKLRIYPTTKPDIDNLSKALADALNGLVWKDDSIIYSLTAIKLYAPKPGILLYVFDN